MHVLSIVSSPPKEQSVSRAAAMSIADGLSKRTDRRFLCRYMKQVDDIVIDTLNVWQKRLPEFDAETINTKYKGVSGETMLTAEDSAWEKIRELASRFRRAGRIVMGVPIWNFSFPYKLNQLFDLSCQRNTLFTFDGKRYGPVLSIEKVFVVYAGGQSDEAGFKHIPQPGFAYLSDYIKFWLRFIGVRHIVSLTVEHTGGMDWQLT